MSGADRAYGLLKSVMLMGERFYAIDRRLEGLAGDLAALGRSHADLAQRMAAMEGYVRGRADQAALQPRLPDGAQ